MKVLLVSQDERNSFLLQQLEEEGHDTRLLAKHDTGSWEGLVQRCADLTSVKEWGPEACIIDSPGLGNVSKVLKEAGFKVLGGGKMADRLSSDYIHGMTLLEACKVKTNDYTLFTDTADASEYISGKNQPWLLRYPDGRSHSAENDVEMQLHLENLKGDNLRFTLQRGFPNFLHKDLMLRPQCYLAGMFNEHGLMNPTLKVDLAFNLLPDGQGIPTCEGVNVCQENTKRDLPRDTLKKLEKVLSSVGYIGWVFLGCIHEFDSKTGSNEPCIVDFQLSPPDGFWAAVCGGVPDFGKFIDRCLNPKRSETPYDFYKGYIASRKLTLPPYPLTEACWLPPGLRVKMAQEALPKVSFTRSKWGVYWSEVKAGAFGELEACGPLLGYVVGKGDSYLQASQDVKKIVSSLPAQYLQVKVDDSLSEYNLE